MPFCRFICLFGKTRLTTKRENDKILMIIDFDVPVLFLVRNNQLISLTVDIDDFNLVIILEVLTKLGDVNIHGACVEIVVINPDGLQGEVTLENLVGMASEKGEKFILLGGQLGLLVT